MSGLQTQMATLLGVGCRLTDTALIQQCLEANDQAWAVLLRRYGSFIYTIACRMGLSTENVADVFQSVWLRVISGLRMLQHEPDLSSWLAMLTLRQCRRLKQRQPQPASANVQVGDEPEKRVAEEADLHKTIRLLEQERLVRQAISMLEPPCQRLVMSLLYERHEHVTNGSGAGVASTTPGCNHCLKKLLETLDELGF